MFSFWMNAHPGSNAFPFFFLNVTLLKAVRASVRGQQPAPGEEQHVFTFYLHINSTMDHVCVKSEKGEQGNSEEKNNNNNH